MPVYEEGGTCACVPGTDPATTHSPICASSPDTRHSRPNSARESTTYSSTVPLISLCERSWYVAKHWLSVVCFQDTPRTICVPEPPGVAQCGNVTTRRMSTSAASAPRDEITRNTVINCLLKHHYPQQVRGDEAALLPPHTLPLLLGSGGPTRLIPWRPSSRIL